MRSHMKNVHGIDNPIVRAVTPAEPNIVQVPAAAANAQGQADAAQVADSGKTEDGQAQGGARRKTKKTKSKKLKSFPSQLSKASN